MPPRRSVTRAPGATPARSLRSSSSIAGDGSVSRRSTRGASKPQAYSTNVDNPRLPEIETQQSYAYGASKTPMLPEVLRPSKKMTVQQMADTLDIGLRDAEATLKQHANEDRLKVKHARNAEAPSQHPKGRASRENSREVSVESENMQLRKTKRTAAWASSIDANPLKDIEEEEESPSQQEEEDDDDEDEEEEEEDDDTATKQDTDPSSFPSGIFDHSYAYERGLRRPKSVKRQSRLRPMLKDIWLRTCSTVETGRTSVERSMAALLAWIRHLFVAAFQTICALPDAPAIPALARLIAIVAALTAASYGFCFIWSTALCDPTSTSTISTNIQRLCGSCNAQPSMPFNFSDGNHHDFRAMSVALNSVTKQMKLIESRMGDKFDTRFSALEKDMRTLRQQQVELNHQIEQIEVHDSPSGNIPSPLIPKVNYFSPDNGAIVNPYKTSPTKAVPLPFYQRIAYRMLGVQKHHTKPPIEALEPWHDVGDCWCSSNNGGSTSDVRLGITLIEPIYPQEIVIEHLPRSGSLSPGVAPKAIEIWANFDHLDSITWQKLGIRGLQTTDPITPDHALIGTLQYDSSPRINHVQAFKLDVNQQGLLYQASEFVVRVVQNYGAEYTCLYRVRMHGEPVDESKQKSLVE